jgi:hypothetical protein
MKSAFFVPMSNRKRFIYTLQVFTRNKFKEGEIGQNMGQIVKTWVKVLGQFDPYGGYILYGLKA